MNTLPRFAARSPSPLIARSRPRPRRAQSDDLRRERAVGAADRGLGRRAGRDPLGRRDAHRRRGRGDQHRHRLGARARLRRRAGERPPGRPGIAGASVAAGTVVVVTALSTGWVLSAAGEAIAFVPNEIGRALLYNERITR